jgi:hypothetical protein
MLRRSASVTVSIEALRRPNRGESYVKDLGTLLGVRLTTTSEQSTTSKRRQSTMRQRNSKGLRTKHISLTGTLNTLWFTTLRPQRCKPRNATAGRFQTRDNELMKRMPLNLGDGVAISGAGLAYDTGPIQFSKRRISELLNYGAAAEAGTDFAALTASLKRCLIRIVSFQ